MVNDSFHDDAGPHRAFFCSLELLKGKRVFSSCRAAQTAITKGYKSLYHKAGLLFYRKINTKCGTALVVVLF